MKNYGNCNSQIEIILGLTREMLRDLRILDPSVYSERQLKLDTMYLDKRCSSEGLEFLTTTLPKLGKWFDNFLDQGVFSPRPDGFKPFDGKGLPRFLGSFWIHFQVEDPAPQLVRAIRTFLFCFYKLELPFSNEQRSTTLERFVKIDANLEDFSICYENAHEMDKTLIHEMRRVCHETIAGFSPKSEDLQSHIPLTWKPKHGPGAVATGERDEQKWEFTHLYESVHRSFPYYEYVYGMRSNGRALQLASTAMQYKNMVRIPEPMAKVVLVPKDSRGPRIISCEPLEVQFLQQMIAGPLVKHLETRSSAAGHINFTDQRVNGRLALASSLCKSHATLDLSEASDRVSFSLVKHMFLGASDSSDNFWKRVFDLRSTSTILPDGRIVHLNKFAPMGSALCFPVESIIFYSVAVAAVSIACGSRSLARRAVYVYGDDIVVETAYYWHVVSALELVGLKVNTLKSFHGGNFRESCGVDAFNGAIVTPQRIRKLPGTHLRHGSSLAAWCAYASGFHQIGMHNSAAYCHKAVESVPGVKFIPYTDTPRGFMSVVYPPLATPYNGYGKLRYCGETFVCQANLWVLRDKRRSTTLADWGRLAKGVISPDPNYPGEVVVKNATQMSRKWVPVSGTTFADWVLVGG